MSQPRINFNNPLADFVRDNAISLAEIGQLSGSSKSTAGRFLRGETDPSYTDELLRKLAHNLPHFLVARGMSAAEIDQKLLQVFTRGEYTPMITSRTILPPHVAKFFGFSENLDPFSEAPKTKDEVFISKPLKERVDLVIDAIKYQKFVAIVGEIGSGKTVIRSLVDDEISRNETLRLIFPESFDMHAVSPGMIASAILDEFEAKVPRDAVKRATAVKRLLKRLYSEGIRVAIAFDECHRMNDTAISSFKNFLEMNSGGFQRYLGVILFGQPYFASRLRDHKFREIGERITVKEMPDFHEIAPAYLQHRLNLVGADITELFDAEALDLICRQSKTPLALGNITNTALIETCDFFQQKKVVGSAIATKMNFAKPDSKVVSMSKKAG
jgi:type II secretory pathway predicted ATPase ExeA